VSATATAEPAAYAASHGLDAARLPRHAAIIMDGNGRWARRRGWERILGHRRGTETVRAVTTECVHLGIQRLTLYAFSSENWARPAREVSFLMDLLADFIDSELPTMHEHGVRLTAIGRLARLPGRVRERLDHAIAVTAHNPSTVLCLALSYGGRDELVDACRQLAGRVARGELAPEAIDEAAIQGALYAPQAPDVDVVIRTAAEHRLSNFLPWQSSYAEYVSHPACWPEFTVEDFRACLRDFQGRERRFGAVPAL
jgi:undecaprenyl diphosphate synthase